MAYLLVASTLPHIPTPHHSNTTSPWYTLPHLFSQHACEVGRGGTVPMLQRRKLRHTEVK